MDKINIADVSVRDLRAHFAVVPQSPFLFEGTLRYPENVNVITCISQLFP